MAATAIPPPATWPPAGASDTGAWGTLAVASGSPREATVEDVVGRHGTVVVRERSTLHQAAQQLSSHDRTSAIVANSAGVMVGAITENDILNAYASGVPGHYTVEAWLSSDVARCPSRSLRTLSVRPCTPLLQAAGHLKAQQDDYEHACHHVLVKDRAGTLRGIISCLDIVRGLAHHLSDEEMEKRLGSLTVQDLMKPRSSLPVCDDTADLDQAVERMLAFHQNCVLIAKCGSKRNEVLGVVTTRDALRAFADHTPVTTSCQQWLRALQAKVEPRLVPGDTPLAQACAKMSDASLHHLVVVSPDTSEVLGVISASDVAAAFGANA